MKKPSYYVTLIMLIWAVSLVTWVTYQLFFDITRITGAATAAYTALLGIPPTAWGAYVWARERQH